MKGKMLLACGLVLAILTVLACARPPRDTSIAISCDEFAQQKAISREIRVPLGSSFQVTLCSNPTTGFRWEDTKIAEGNYLEQTSHAFGAPQKAPVGAAGTEVWSFKARQKGQTTISIDYSRPWAGGEKGEWKFTLTVIIE